MDYYLGIDQRINNFDEQNNNMQELYQLIKQRFERARNINNSQKTGELLKELREEQKNRCEKQAWILSMFRAKKNQNPNLKNSYFNYSYAIMQLIEPGFQYDVEVALTEETFLNDFVCLYTKFFDQYENKFNFKVKIRNLLRPTNHNIVNDLIKYLSDFSRDYCQYLYFWQFKNAKKAEEDVEEEIPIETDNPQKMASIDLERCCPSSQKRQNSREKQQVMSSRKVSGHTDNQPPQTKKSTDDLETESPTKKGKQFNRLYGVLDVQSPNNFILSEKSRLNLDVMKLRLNEIYRDIKFRNSPIRKSIITYYCEYFPNSSNVNRQCVIEEYQPNFSLPFRISISFQKNGFSCLNLMPFDSKTLANRQLSPIKEKPRASSLTTRNRQIQSQQLRNNNQKSDFMLNSLKILRVSQNFLPPLVCGVNTNRNSQQTETRIETKNSSLQKISPNTENIMNLQLVNGENDFEIRKEGVTYYNQELARESERRKIQKKRISELRKHFTSEQRMKQTRKKLNDPQEKIVEWLDKINMMKQLERKKIMGLG